MGLRSLSLVPTGGSEVASKVVLVGFMGAGKSTAARAAADTLGLEAVDLDAVIETRLGKSISSRGSFS